MVGISPLLFLDNEPTNHWGYPIFIFEKIEKEFNLQKNYNSVKYIGHREVIRLPGILCFLKLNVTSKLCQKLEVSINVCFL